MAKKVELIVARSDKSKLRYKYGIEGGPFNLYATSRDLATHRASVKTLVDHIECEKTYETFLIDYTTITQYFKEKLQSDLKYKVKEIKTGLHKVFELNVSTTKYKIAKKEILETISGSFVDSCSKLKGYDTELRSCNPEFDIVINLSKKTLSNENKRFFRMYICFKSIQLGFKAELRPFIRLGSTFLKGKAKGQVLIVVDQDNMNCFTL
ncbi:hypothetical protein RDI58_000655 [Solanum bulbocastanum]|uniref:Uncharacterized protein n=1 Tax=Solanum bulbocastanum TaxID=147425 RepID=A0AAN8UBC0_SOLBU